MNTRLPLSLNLFCKLSAFSILSLLTSTMVLGQMNTEQHFFEIVSDDSVRLYCDDQYGFTSVNCFDFLRNTRMTNDAKFEGSFVDQHNSTVLATGTYREGLKQGYFQVFYPNGNIKSKGYYNQNAPSQDWFYFHENGLPERHLQFSATDTLVIQQANEKGDVTVVGGNGQFDGEIEGRLDLPGLWAKGEIKDGKRTGKWITYFPSTKVNKKTEYSHEEYLDGKLIKGEYPGPDGKKNRYTNSPFFRFFLSPDIVKLEKFQFHECVYKTTEFATLKTPAIFDRVILSVLYSREFQYMGNISSPIRIQFDVTLEGLPLNFRIQNRFYPDLTNRLIYAIKQYVRFIPASRNGAPFASVLYFNVEYAGGGQRFRYSITNN
jgi:antitoxin component YwqK of YwqJK toxin-antitoxin module